MSLPQELITLLNLDGFVFFIEGNKGKGKTNFALLLAEICYAYKYRQNIATNIKTQCWYIKYITNYPDLETWLKKDIGKKLFILDESGRHMGRMSFMSSQNKGFMDILQLIRHYDAGFIGIAPSSKRVDSGFMNTDILDAKIKKISLLNAKVTDYFNNECYFLNDLPKTSIFHRTKDLANFSMDKPLDVADLQDCCKFAHWYYKTGNLKTALQAMGEGKPHFEEGKRLLMKHLKHTEISRSNTTVEDSVTIEPEKTP